MMKPKEANRLRNLQSDIDNGVLTESVLRNMLDNVISRKGMSDFEDSRIAMLEKYFSKSEEMFEASMAKNTKAYWLWHEEDIEIRKPYSAAYMHKHAGKISRLMKAIPSNMHGYIYDLVKDAHKAGFKDGIIVERQANEPVRLGGMN